MRKRGISIEGVASEIGALGRQKLTVDKKDLIEGLQRRFHTTYGEAELAITHAINVGVIQETENSVSIVLKCDD